MNTNVFQMSINDLALPTSAFITKQSQNFYGLGVNPHTGEVLVSDAVDYVQRGVIYRYKSNGNLIGTF